MKNKTSEKKPIHQKLHSTISSTAFRVISWQCSRCEGSYCKVTAQSSCVYHPMCPHQCDLGTSSTASSCFVNLQTHSQKQKNIEPKKTRSFILLSEAHQTRIHCAAAPKCTGQNRYKLKVVQFSVSKGYMNNQMIGAS